MTWSTKTMKRGAWLAAAIAPFAMFDYARSGIVNETWLYTICGLLGSIGIVAGVRINRSPDRGAWYLIALGNLSFVVGDLISWYLYARGGVSFPDIPDIPYLACYPLMAWGLGLLVRGRGRGQGNIIDASIVATSAALLGWVFIMEPYATDPSLTFGAKVVSIAYPMGDLLLLATACWLLMSGVRRNPALRWLMASMAARLGFDIAYAITALQGTYSVWVDTGYLFAYLTLASAAFHPSMREISPPQSSSLPSLSRRRLVLLTVGAIIGPGLLALSAQRGAHVDLRVLAGGSIVLFLLAILRIAGLARSVEQNASLLAEQKAQLGDALSELQIVERDRKRLLEAVLSTSELERSSIAADLHDGPIQQLTALGLNIELAAMEFESEGMPSAVERLRELQNGFSEQISSLRTLMMNLRPPVLEERGVAAALEDHLVAFSTRTGITFEADLAPIRLERSIETVLYRVSQEALTNIAKHSRGSRAELKLQRDGDGVVLEITDDGVGFNVAREDGSPALGHVGLVSMRERVELAGGSLQLTSSPGKGTRIRVRFDQIGDKDAGITAPALAQ